MSTPTEIKATTDAPAGAADSLAPLVLGLTPQDVGTRLDTLSKRGKLPDYRREGTRFSVNAYGNQMDMTLAGTIEGRDGGSVIRFTLERQWKLVIIYAVITIVTIWPGLALTDSMLSTYFSGYDFATWMWYVPLVVLPTPLLAWREARKSAAMARESAAELIERIRAAMA